MYLRSQFATKYAQDYLGCRTLNKLPKLLDPLDSSRTVLFVYIALVIVLNFSKTSRKV